MCGIAGLRRAGAARRAERDRARRCALMRHRGPDDARAPRASDRRTGARVELLHTRLSIIDLDPRSNQPFQVGGTLDRLQRRALQLRRGARRARRARAPSSAPSPTPRCCCAALDRGGWDALDRCEGMWAFATYDERDRRADAVPRPLRREAAVPATATATASTSAPRSKFVVALLGRVAAGQPRASSSATSSTATRRSTRPRETFFEGLEELPAGRAGCSVGPAGEERRGALLAPRAAGGRRHVATRRRSRARASG